MANAQASSLHSENILRMSGWFLLTLGLLMATAYHSGPLPLQGSIILFLLLGIWFILRASQFFDVSHSTHTLLEEEMRAAEQTFPHPTLVDRALSDVRIFAFLTVILAASLAFIGATFLTLSILLLYVLAVVYWTAHHRRWSLLVFLTLCTYATLAIWLIPTPLTGQELPRGLAAIALFGCTYIFSFPFILRVRHSYEREMVRFLLALIYTLLTLLVIQETTGVHGVRALIQLAPALLALGCGLVAWLSHQRRSYAKYFFGIALAALFLVAMTNLGLPSLIGLGLIIGAGVCLVGILQHSYSARLAGMGILVLAHFLYLTNLLQLLWQGVLLSSSPEQASLALLFALTLPVLAVAYSASTSLRDRESYLRPLLVEVLLMTAIGMVALVAYIATNGLTESIIWALAALAGTLGGRQYRLTLVSSISTGLLILALLKIICVDLPLLFH